MLSFFLITSRAFNTLYNYRISGVYQSAPLSVLFSLYRYFNLLWCRNNSRIWLMFHDLIRNARRDVPVRIRHGIVQIHVKTAFRTVVRVAANNRNRAQVIPLYIYFCFFLLSMRGRNPPIPLAAMPLKAFCKKGPARCASSQPTRNGTDTRKNRMTHRSTRCRQQTQPQQSSD